MTWLRGWLDRREEGVIVLVGHGQFFKRLLKRPDTQPNVSIMKCTYAPGEGFSEPTLCGVGFAEPGGDTPAPRRAPKRT